MSSGLYDLMTVAAPSVQNTCDKSAPTCAEDVQEFNLYMVNNPLLWSLNLLPIAGPKN